MNSITNGCLLLADIGGYTKYLSGVELEHSHDVMADLIQTVVGRLCGPFTLAKLEGDAVFCYFDGDPPPGEKLIEAIDTAYSAFYGRLRDIRFATTCHCDACRLIPSLTLKFVVHSGQFVLHEVAGQRELIGKDVILIHRLLKNRVVETHGISAYALMTRQCVEDHGIDPAEYAMVEHSEEYEDVGVLQASVLDLESRLVAEAVARNIRVEGEDTFLILEALIPQTPAQTWEWVTDPNRRLRWMAGMTGIEQRNPPAGRGPGTQNHCMHGPTVVLEEIMDWKPPSYFTSLFSAPEMLASLWTYEFEPAGGQTLMRARLRLVEELGDTPGGRAFVEQMREAGEVSVERLIELLDNEDA